MLTLPHNPRPICYTLSQGFFGLSRVQANLSLNQSFRNFHYVKSENSEAAYILCSPEAGGYDLR